MKIWDFHCHLSGITGSGLSLMPDGIEATISVAQMPDLIAFLLAPQL